MKLQLRSLRKEKKITQLGLADTLGVDLKTIGNWERGKTIMSTDQLCRCCEALGCTPNELTGWYIEHPEDLPVSSMSNEESALLDNYRACTPERRQVVSAAARDQCSLSRGQEAPCTSSDLAAAV